MIDSDSPEACQRRAPEAPFRRQGDGQRAVDAPSVSAQMRSSPWCLLEMNRIAKGCRIDRQVMPAMKHYLREPGTALAILVEVGHQPGILVTARLGATAGPSPLAIGHVAISSVFFAPDNHPELRVACA